MAENTFQEQLDEFFGGSTGGALGPDVISSALRATTSEVFDVGYTPATLGKGVQLYAVPGAGPPESALIDFNSKNNPGTQSFDARIEVSGGENNVFGRGAFNIFANSYGFNGNPANAVPQMNYYGDAFYRVVPIVPSVNHGRTIAVQQVAWTDTVGTNPGVAVRVIQLRDPTTLTPLFGQFVASYSNGYSGTGNSIYQATFSVAKSTVGNVNVASEVEGDDLSNLYIDVTWNAGGFPQINIYNKTSDNARYLITGTVFPDNNGY